MSCTACRRRSLCPVPCLQASSDKKSDWGGRRRSPSLSGFIILPILNKQSAAPASMPCDVTSCPNDARLWLVYFLWFCPLWSFVSCVWNFSFLFSDHFLFVLLENQTPFTFLPFLRSQQFIPVFFKNQHAPALITTTTYCTLWIHVGVQKSPGDFFRMYLNPLRHEWCQNRQRDVRTSSVSVSLIIYWFVVETRGTQTLNKIPLKSTWSADFSSVLLGWCVISV